MSGLIDSHCHLDAEQFNDDREAVIERAFAAGIDHMMAIGTGDGPPDFEAGIRLADRYAPIYCTVGVHPHDAAKADDCTMNELEALLRHPKVLAIGEMGLDYHYDFSPREKQRAVFIDQLALARDSGMPIVIHTRDAWDDTLQILDEHWAGSPHGGIMHCFSGGVEEAQRSLALGFHISFAGVVTFPKALAVQAAAREVPLDRLLIETDAPYLAPAPHRGKRNEPSFLGQTARKLAELRGMSLEEITSLTATNFRQLCLKT